MLDCKVWRRKFLRHEFFRYGGAVRMVEGHDCSYCLAFARAYQWCSHFSSSHKCFDHDFCIAAIFSAISGTVFWIGSCSARPFQQPSKAGQRGRQDACKTKRWNTRAMRLNPAFSNLSIICKNVVRSRSGCQVGRALLCRRLEENCKCRRWLTLDRSSSQLHHAQTLLGRQDQCCKSGGL